eukprot:TRINITY_DN70219_c0_g1_i1.p1 TRINITY_DN70219_c0_g1~~TRINITY_DN70219_c0_g1_i1.p1  ORF type:complete len:629 (-),score=134.59 TRINITY_DN70219_c0_g1_i1:91-1977(-)
MSRLWVFICFCMAAQAFMSYDGGATPACVDEIQKAMPWTQAELGLLGSLDKFGMTVSAVIWGRVLQLMPAKAWLVLCFVIEAASALAFGSVQSKTVMYIAKLVMGVAQGLKIVWSTCWTLQYAPDDKRTAWLGAGALAAGIGNGFGTVVAGFGTSHGLPYSFAWQVEAACLATLWVASMVVPGTDVALESDELAEEASEISEALKGMAKAAEAEDRLSRSSLPVVSALSGNGGVRAALSETEPCKDSSPRKVRFCASVTEISSESSERPRAFSVDIAGRARRSSFTELIMETQLTTRQRAGTDASSMVHISSTARRADERLRRATAIRKGAVGFGEVAMRQARTRSIYNQEAAVVVVKKDTIAQIRDLLRNSLYVSATLHNAAIMFMISGIQFLWVRVFVEVWGLEKGFVVSGFLLSTGGGGVLGVIFGPIAIDRCGSFSMTVGRRKALMFIATMMICAATGSATALAALYMRLQRLGAPGTLGNGSGEHSPGGVESDGLFYAVWLGCLIVFASCNATLAGLTGISVSTLPAATWSLASGLTVSVVNCLGFVMGPLLPGTVMDAVGAKFGWSMTDHLGAAYLLSLGFAFVLVVGTTSTLLLSAASLQVSKDRPSYFGNGAEPLLPGAF